MADDARTLRGVVEEAATCRRCPLYKGAIQTVFGEGPADARIVMVGEQPGDQEDRQGRPFVGPAGRVLDAALAEAGFDRKTIYLTNAVKHFKNEPRGKRRLHKRPNQYEIERCKWWLDRELKLVNPALVVALGATASRALVGKAVVIAKQRGVATTFAGGRRGLITIHPAAILRVRDARDRHQAMAAFVRDLKTAQSLARESRAAA